MTRRLAQRAASVWHRTVVAAKRLIYGRRGEPYQIAGHTLRFIPGTRPVRVQHARSDNDNVRYDALQVLLLSEGLERGDTAIDIGAHCGQYTLIMAAKCGQSGRVIAFEPDPSARAMLHRNLQLNPSIKPPVVEPLALSDREGSAVLHSRAGDSRSSLAEPLDANSGGRGVVQVPVQLITLDSYIEREGLRRPKWVKIDAEGAEIRILQGATTLLAGDAGIVCELHPYAWEAFGSRFEHLEQIAALSGRRIRYLDQDHAVGSSPHYGTVVLERV